MQRPPAPPLPRPRRPVWPIVVGASTIVGLLVGGILGLGRHAAELPPPPSGLTAAATTCAPPRCDRIVSMVTLRWNAPAGASLTGFRVIRDGATISTDGSLPATSTEFVDQGVTAGEQHTYAVIAIGPGGDSPASNGVSTEVPPPPLGAAQFRGIYDVDLQVLRAANLVSLSGIPTPRPGEHRTSTWGFQPLCDGDQGACPTGWTGRSGMLQARGALWSGRLFGPEARCADGRQLPSPIDIRLEPRTANMVAGAWTVVTFSGVYSVGFHCPGFRASRGTVEVTGHHR